MDTHAAAALFQNEDRIFDLRNVFYDLYEHKWLVIIITLITFSMGLLHTLRRAPVYQTNALIQVEREQQRGSGFLASLTKEMGMALGGETPAAVQIALIKSRFVLSPVIKTLHYTTDASPYRLPIIGKFLARKTDKIDVGNFIVPRSLFNKNFQVVVGEKNHYSLYSPDGDLILTGIVGSESTKSADGTIELQINSLYAPINTKFRLIKLSEAHIIDDLISRLKIEEVMASSNSSRASTQDTGIIQITLQDTDTKRLVNTLNTIVSTVQEKDMERKSFEAAKTLDFLTDQLPLVRKSLADAEEKLNHYRTQSGKIDLKLQTTALFTEITSIEKQLNTMRLNKFDLAQRITSQHPFMIALNGKIAELEHAKSKVQNQLKLLPASDQITVNLMREVKVQNSLYLLLLNRIQEMRVAKAGTISNIRVLVLATPPDSPLPTNSKFVYLGSILLGLAISYAILLLRKTLNHKINDPYWLEKRFNLVNLAIIPFSKLQTDNINSATQQKTKNTHLLAAFDPHDLSIEALRNLRTNAQVSLLSATNNIIAIVGISPATGKSFIAANFAYLLADAGKRVLLIDGDTRRGHLQNYFNVKRVPGLVEILYNTATIDEALRSTGHKNLTFLPIGNYPINPSEILIDDRFKELLLSTLSEQFDIIVIDTAPVLAVTDGVLIGALAGTNFLVMGSSAHSPEEVEIAVKCLANAKVKLQGYVFNHLKEELHVYGNYRYNYQYRSRYSALPEHMTE